MDNVRQEQIDDKRPSVSNMVEILLDEALEARKKKKKK